MLLEDKLADYRLLLASRSPRRRELLDMSGLSYELCADFACEEVYPADTPAREVPLYLSRLKSRACPRALGPRDILLTADTVVVCRGKVLGKPRDRADAARMLRTLAGGVHEVVSGVTFRTKERCHSFSALSRVWIRPLREEEIAFYLDRFSPLDKAGAYGVQEWIGLAAVEKINGSFYNVMGLPVQRVYTELERFIESLR